jgi:hypothetical protein
VKSETTKSRTVSFTLDPANPPRWTEEEKRRFDAMTDADIDYSDIPDTSDLTGWTRPGLTERKGPASPNGNRNANGRNAAAKKKTSVA